MKQQYFGGGLTSFGGRKQNDNSKDGHSDDVTALCLSHSRKMVASGQNGQKPIVFLWDSNTTEVIKKKVLPKGSRLVTALGISANDKFVCAADAAEKITVHIFEIMGGASPVSSVSINMKIVHLACNPTDEKHFATVGKDHLCICNIDGDKVSKKQGKAKDKVSHCSVAFFTDSKYSSQCLTGGADGNVYHWNNDSVSKMYQNNKGSVHSVTCAADAANGQIALVGGNDKSMTVYKFDGKLSKLWSVMCDAAPRSLDILNGTILMGLKNGSIVEMDFSQGDKAKPNTVMTSHCDGETWGLNVAEVDGELKMITSGVGNRGQKPI
jgi:hypothetical protein